eukprot:m.181047 g.181047  ORF g.181047 m.181047 type:complete len:648 (+) comp15157_c0_seq1:89-2032(+)
MCIACMSVCGYASHRPHQPTTRNGLKSKFLNRKVGICKGKSLEFLLVNFGNHLLVRRRDLGSLPRKLLIEIVRVRLVLHRGLERWGHLAVFKGLPVDGIKERMRFDVLFAVGPATEAVSNPFAHETTQNSNRYFCQPHWKQDIVVQNGFKEIVFSICLKRRLSRQHLVHQDTQGPPVHRRAIHLLLENLGCNIVWCSAKGVGQVAILNTFFAHPKVGNLDMAFAVEHDIVKLEITVNDTAFVQKQEAANDLRRVKPRPFLIKLAGALNVVHQVATRDKLHDKEKLVGSLKARMQRRQKRVLACQGQHTLLYHGAFDIVILLNHVLLQHLDGKHVTRPFELGQHHLAKTTLAKHLGVVEIVWRVPLHGFGRRGGGLHRLGMHGLGDRWRLHASQYGRRRVGSRRVVATTGGVRTREGDFGLWFTALGCLELLRRRPELGEFLGHEFGVDTTRVWHDQRAFFMDVDFAGFALLPLTNQTPQERAAMVAKREKLVRFRLKLMGHVDVEPLSHTVCLWVVLLGWRGRISRHTWTCRDHARVTSLVTYQSAHLALVPLLAQAPDKVMTVGTECRLSEKPSHKLVSIGLVDFPSFDGNFSLVECILPRLEFLGSHFLCLVLQLDFECPRGLQCYCQVLCVRLVCHNVAEADRR